MTLDEWLGEDNQLGKDIWHKKYQYNDETFDEWIDRVSGGDARVKQLIRDKKFLFGGRILANRGLNKHGKRVTYSNCFRGDTRIVTRNGVQPIGSLVGQDIQVFSFGNWRNATVKCFGAQEIGVLSVADGDCMMDFHVTKDHIWYVSDKGEYRECKTIDLKYGDALPTSDPNNQDFSEPVWRVCNIDFVNTETAPVYCVVEPERHSFTLEGNILTHNCYVISPPGDNLESIFDTAKSLARTYSYGGGCGIDIGKLAPSGAIVNNAAEHSSGAVSFMDLYSLVTGLISQNGRRGALMISIPVDHPDVQEFIHIKSDLNRVTKANISVRISDKFMQAAQDGEYFKLSFNRKETGETIEKVVKADELFMELAKMNWDYAEPGILFWDRINNWNLLSCDDNFHYAGTNPCAEEPLPAGGSCLLGSINLSEFVNEQGEFDFDDFKMTVGIATEALNDVLDEGLPLHPLKEQRDSVRDWRQIGLGIMGLADMLIKMGITYGSEKAEEISDRIGYAMINAALKRSAIIASDKGTYPKYNKDAVFASNFFHSNADHETLTYVDKYGLRNSQILTIAPTGTLSTMLGISGGIEPIFANYYTRKTESLMGHDEYYKVYTKIVRDYMDAHGLKDDSELPEYFITAHELGYHERIAMQAAWQNHIDASISSTCNLNHDATVEDVADLYMTAWEEGLKGITVYRDGCARAGILTDNDSKKDDDSNEVQVNEIPRGVIIKADDNCVGKKRTLYTGCGTLHVEAFFDPVTGNLLETYFSKGSTGGCNSYMTGLSRMVSLASRGGVPISAIIDQLKSTLPCPSYAVRSATKHDTSRGTSCPVAIGNALLEMYNEMQNDLSEDDYDSPTQDYTVVKVSNVDSNSNATIASNKGDGINTCPVCGTNLRHTGGCDVCENCGWSHCQ